MATIPEPMQDLLDAFALMEDRQERIEALIDWADRFEPVPDSVGAPPYPESARVPNCESEAFCFAAPDGGGALRYHFAVLNPQGVSAMALAAIIGRTLSGQPPERVCAVEPDVVYTLFGRELSMGKTAGLMGMMQMVRALTKQRVALGARADRAAEEGAGS